MKFHLCYAALVALLALQSEQASSFTTTPSHKNIGTVSSGTAFVTTKNYGTSSSVPFLGSSSTELSMGKFEEFLTGRDDKAREKENEKYLAQLQKRVEKINELEADVENLGDDELMAKTEEFKERLKKGEDINGSILEEAFAVVREAAWYVAFLDATVNKRHTETIFFVYL